MFNKMIYGIGTDILDINRIKEVITKYENKFLLRFFSSDEIKESKNKINKNLFFAERFSAKEAFWKAVSPSKNEFIKFNEIEILCHLKNIPVINLLGETKRFFEVKEKNLNKNFTFHISLSSVPPNVLSYVVIYLSEEK